MANRHSLGLDPKYLVSFTVGIVSATLTLVTTAISRLTSRVKPNPNWVFLLHIYHDCYKQQVLKLLKRGVRPSQIVLTSSRESVVNWATSLGIRALIVGDFDRNFEAFKHLVAPDFTGEIYVHLHSKRSPQLGLLGLAWGRFLWFVLSDFGLIRKFERLERDQNLELLFPHLNRLFREWGSGWSHWRWWIEKLPKSPSYKHLEQHSPKLFPAGGMFICNDDRLSDILRLYNELQTFDEALPLQEGAGRPYFFERSVVGLNTRSRRHSAIVDFGRLIMPQREY